LWRWIWPWSQPDALGENYWLFFCFTTSLLVAGGLWFFVHGGAITAAFLQLLLLQARRQ